MAHMAQGATTNILVLGAGYAGLLSAVRIARKTRGAHATVTLINASDTFTQRLRLHQFATGQHIVWRSIPKTLLDTGVQFIRARVTSIAPERNEVTLQADGQAQTLGYDYLVYALGSEIDRFGAPGVDAYAYTLAPRGPLSAETLRSVLPDLAARGGTVTICGGGPTGIETAAEVASAYPRLRVRLVTQGQFGMFLGKGVAVRMRRALDRLHVSVTDQTSIVEVGERAARTADGQSLAHDICIWTGGFRVGPLAHEAGILVNARDQIVIDPTMRSISHPAIFAIGDAAWPQEQPGAPVRMSAVTAAIMGAHGADCVSAVVRGKTPAPFSFAYLGQGIALGRGAGIGFNNYPDDVPVPPYFTGWLGYQMREVFVKYLANTARFERRWLGSFVWLGKGRYAASKRRMPASQVNAIAAGASRRAH